MSKFINKLISIGLHPEKPREKWLQQTLQQIPSGTTILDAGAGECQFKKFCTHLNYISQDFGAYNGSGDVGLQTGTWDVSTIDIISDITQIPLENNSMGAILCTEVFEHIPDVLSALKEFQRLVRPGGYLVITVPFNSYTHFAPFHFATGFNRFFFEKHLPDLGFEIKDLQFNGNYFECLAVEMRHIKRVSAKYAAKKINIIDKLLIHLNLAMLQRLSKRDKGSSELSNCGVHILAQKKIV